jgi:hypothetical protein
MFSWSAPVLRSPSGYVASGCFPGAVSAIGWLLTTMSKPDVAVVRRCRSTCRELVSDLTRRETPLIIFNDEAGAQASTRCAV